MKQKTYRKFVDLLSCPKFKYNLIIILILFLLLYSISGSAAAGGGPDCIGCHDVANETSSYNVSVSAMNQSDNIHARLNFNMRNTASIPENGGNANNSICWGCHQSNGIKPDSHPDRQTNPYKCDECHNETTNPYTNVSSAPVAKEHFKSGDNIKAVTTAANATESCIECHNQTEMKRTDYTEPDTNYTKLSLASHYGKKRDDLVAWNNTSTYCMYCHNTSVAFSSTNFSVTNDSMENHSTVINCTNQSCHASGRIHDESLDKNETGRCENCHDEMDTTLHKFPVLSCLQCHNNNTLAYTGTKLYTGSYNAKTTIHSTDNTSSNTNTLSPLCTECHTKTAAEIQEGYENASGGYAMMDDNITLAPYGSNMTHNRDTLTTKGAFGTDPPGPNQAEGDMYARHANPNTSGAWAGTFNLSRAAYPNQVCINCHSENIDDEARYGQCSINVCHKLYDITDNYPIAHEVVRTECSYCHFSGNILNHIFSNQTIILPKNYLSVILEGDVINDNVHRNMTWDTAESRPTNQTGCLVCHTNVSFTIDYTAGPLKINITDRFGVHTWNSNPDCTKCHSLTGASEGPTIHAHVSFVSEGNNTQCLDTCHKGNKEPFTGLAIPLSRGHGHDVQPAGGPDCIGCHDIGKQSPKVNFTIVNNSLSVHQNISTYDSITDVDGVNDTNKICWACHMNNSQYTDKINKKAHADRLGDFNGVPVYTCDECHVDNIAATASIMPDRVLVKEHYYGGDELKAGNSIDNLNSCEICHNLSEMKLDVILDKAPGGTDPEDQSNASYLIAHYGRKRGVAGDEHNLRTWDGGVNCSYCHQDSNSAFAKSFIMVNYILNSSILNHSINYPLSSANNCTNANCHGSGWMHNASLTKPIGLTTNYSDSVSSSQVCLNCHGPDNYSTYTSITGLKQRHNDTLNCTECHLYEARDIHGVKYLQQDDTYSTSNISAVNCQDCHASNNLRTNITATDRPKVPMQTDFNFTHSQVNNGLRWANVTFGSYWNNTNEACEYCHNDTKHSVSALGRITSISSGNVKNISIGDDTWCSGCHYKSDSNYDSMSAAFSPVGIAPEITNGTNWQGVFLDYYNHSLLSYDDSACGPCHGSLLVEKTTKEFPHRVAEGNFGANCTWCHDISSDVAPRINVTALNSTFSIHSNVRTYSAISNPYSSNTSDVNKICWLCHMNDSNAPGNYTDHADRVRTSDNNLAGPIPFTCDECHVLGVSSSVNASVLVWAPDVVQHFAQASKLTAGNTSDNLTSCRNCHNLTGMKVTSNLPPIQGINSTGWYSLVSHYGKKRSVVGDSSDLRIWAGGVNCSYCHQNGGNEFSIDSIMTNKTFNTSIPEHSRYDSTPNCTNATCHDGGWMHNASLTKPDLMIDGAEDSAICLSCHDSANYSTYMSLTTPKSRHNDTLNCSECHLSEARDIHGVKYLQQDDTYNTSNSSAVNCYTCHSSGAVDSNINVTIPKVPDDNYGFSHSEAPTSGSRWNYTNYWKDSNGACEFCHNDTKHNTSALGFIDSVKGDNDRNVSLDGSSNSYWCSICHNSSSSYYNGNKRSPVPPTIFRNNTNNITSWDGTGQSWYNHSSINSSNYNDIVCKGCHGSLLSTTPTTTEFVHKVAAGGGKYCVECHDIGGSVTAKFQIDVQAMNKSDAIHYDLNRAAIDEMNKSENPDNVRCWACHGDGDGSDAAQLESGHPLNYNNPKNCADKDCHNINQSIFNEPMIYEHFRYVDEIDENVSTSVDCIACHLNSIMSNNDNIIPSSTSLVSHYGSTDDLINTTSCIYCHLDEDNAEEWGNAPDPTTNISRLSDEELEITLLVGDKWHLGNRYFLVFEDIGINGDNAFLRLYHNDTILEEIVVSADNNFTYEGDFIDPDGDMEYDLVVLKLNFTAVFRGEQIGLVKVEGRSWKRIHPEDKDPACWACHMDDYTVDKKKYLVLDEDEDRIYYLEKLLDFSDEDTEDKVTLIPRKLVLIEGDNQTLDVDGNYILTANEVDINGKQAHITLVKDGSVIEDSIYSEGEIIEFEYDLSSENHNIDDFVILTAKVDSVFHGFDTDIVSLTEVRVFSDRLMEADIDDDDEKVGGYNTSQLHINDNFSIGGSPDTFHVPTLNEGQDGGSDCVKCHDVSNGFGISSVDAIQSRLGGHSQLNANATSKVNLTDDINKACWACHGEGVDPGRHPADYLYPRQCQDCHTYMELPTYGAVDLSDENHGQIEDCNRCHAADYPGVHVINVFEPDLPYIVSINMSSEVVTFGETVTVNAAAMSSWKMKVKTIEYFIDVEGPPGTGTQLMPLDGTFDEQVEEVEFTIDTTGLELGDHTVYIRAMERDNKWGPINEAVFSIQIPTEAEQESMPITLIVIGTGTSLAVLWLLLRKWKFA